MDVSHAGAYYLGAALAGRLLAAGSCVQQAGVLTSARFMSPGSAMTHACDNKRAFLTVLEFGGPGCRLLSTPAGCTFRLTNALSAETSCAAHLSNL